MQYRQTFGNGDAGRGDCLAGATGRGCCGCVAHDLLATGRCGPTLLLLLAGFDTLYGDAGLDGQQTLDRVHGLHVLQLGQLNAFHRLAVQRRQRTVHGGAVGVFDANQLHGQCWRWHQLLFDLLLQLLLLWLLLLIGDVLVVSAATAAIVHGGQRRMRDGHTLAGGRCEYGGGFRWRVGGRTVAGRYQLGVVAGRVDRPICLHRTVAVGLD